MQSIAIIPAAGRSRRMGEPKLLLPWEGRPLIEHMVSIWRASGVSHVVVVVSGDDPSLLEVCKSLNVDVAIPDSPPPEMKDSVACGLRYVRQKYSPSAGDVWLLAPADLPGLSATVIDQLLAAHSPSAPAILAAAHQGQRGHPVLFPWPLAAEVQRLGADQGVNALMEGRDVRLIQCGPSALSKDIDTPEDYRRWQGDK